METIIKTSHVQSRVTVTHAEQRTESKFWNEVESARFALIPMILMIIGCMGGIGAAFGAKADIFKLALIAFPTILSLGFVLAVTPMRLIIWASSIAVALDILVLFI